MQQTLALGQVNLLLMLLAVADLLTPSALRGQTRWWHGIGIGVAAGIKLIPLIFIPYLLLTRRYRQATTAAAPYQVRMLTLMSADAGATTVSLNSYCAGDGAVIWY